MKDEVKEAIEKYGKILKVKKFWKHYYVMLDDGEEYIWTDDVKDLDFDVFVFRFEKRVKGKFSRVIENLIYDKLERIYDR